MNRIVTIVGARPQFIKAAAVSRALRRHTDLSETLVHTGQHYDANMSEVFFDELSIPRPDYRLESGSGKHGAQTGRMLAAIEEVLLKETPDSVMVYGDTNTTLAGALAAVKLHIPVIHVEAGLRSFNLRMPEEINRVLTDRCSTLLVAPTSTAVENLRREGVDPKTIHLIGDVMYDAVRFYGDRATKESRIHERLGLGRGDYILSTIHRAENTDCRPRLAAILGGLAQVSERRRVILPLHPRTRALLASDAELTKLADRIEILDPVGYFDMIALEKDAALVATDSGGVQKEAFFFRVPCVTLRDETEWTELVNLKWNRLAPPETAGAVSDAVQAALGTRGEEASPYGEGDAADRLVSLLREGHA